MKQSSGWALLALLCMSPAVIARCTKTVTAYSTTHTTTTSFIVLPSITLTSYSATVLVGTPYDGPHPYIEPTIKHPLHCTLYTGKDILSSPASASAVVKVRGAVKAACATTTTTVPVEKARTLYSGEALQNVSPPPLQVSQIGTLTTSVPIYCTAAPRVIDGTIPNGTLVRPLAYPYFAQTHAECCIACYKQFDNLVAAAFIKSGLDCQCLLVTSDDYPHKSQFCPNGKVPYAFHK
ncbi:hypothetical protein LTR49_026096, partial [Elasticomyces elasticus]